MITLPQIEAPERALGLKAGEWVEVRSLNEILSTLDTDSCIDGLPFMPEMVQYCGKRYRVYKSAHKTCDTTGTFKLRRMADAVHLEELRCDGGSHAGCQAGCLIFWKEAWLKRVPAGSEPPRRTIAATEGDTTGLHTRTQYPAEDGQPVRYRCQATDLPSATKATTRRDLFDPRFYVKDLTSRNVTPIEFVRFGLFAMLNSFLLRWFDRRFPHVCGLASGKTPSATLDLQPGELVQVKSKAEILRTLNKETRNRGLGFDVEMVQYCENGEYKVLRRIEKIINEKTGLMMTLPNPCIVLDGVVCSGHYSKNRMFCPRAVFPYWREIWLKRDGETKGRPSSV